MDCKLNVSFEELAIISVSLDARVEMMARHAKESQRLGNLEGAEYFTGEKDKAIALIAKLRTA